MDGTGPDRMGLFYGVLGCDRKIDRKIDRK
jgi:hypothetical protein